MAKVSPVQAEVPGRARVYPTSKQNIAKKAEEEGADENIRSTLEQLPDQNYETPADVSKAIGELE